jgi:SAM-dependent methyltransferase
LPPSSKAKLDHTDTAPKYLKGDGVEIGAYIRPIPCIKPIYVDRYSHYAGEDTCADYYGDACDLPFHDSSLDYVASSHLLEHAANPLQALSEWFRVLKHGGIIYTVIPDRQRIFDHPRPLTEVAHMVEDFRNETTMADPTHIEDFALGVDWKEFSPDSDPENYQKERDAYVAMCHKKLETQGEINIHFHTYESHTAVELIKAGNQEPAWPGRMEVLEIQEKFPFPDHMGFLIVARVYKNLGTRLSSLFGQKGIKEDAKKFEKS